MRSEIDSSVKNFLDELGKIVSESKSKLIRLDLLEKGTRGDGRDEYDFTGKTLFYGTIYPKLKDLVGQIHQRGIIEGYIKEN